MKLSTWKSVFYPDTAEEAVRTSERFFRPDRALIQHALLMWKGLRKSSLFLCFCKLAPYGVTPLYAYPNLCVTPWFMPKERVPINGASCSLCKVYQNDVRGECARCPIVRATGYRCLAEFTTFQRTKNPEPMIKLLEETLAATPDV